MTETGKSGLLKRIFIALAAVGIAAAALAGAAGLRPSGGYASYPGQNSSLIRFHVIANSDSPNDQALKLEVRDAVIREMTPVLAECKDIEEARGAVDANLGLIAAAAERTLSRRGYDYPVSVFRGIYEFPRKTYRIKNAGGGGEGDLTLPAGEYEAVRVVIGSGRGANWWCVLFPPLCFVGSGIENSTPGGRQGTYDNSQPGAPAFRYDPAPSEKAELQSVEYRLKVVEWYDKFRNWEFGTRSFTSVN